MLRGRHQGLKTVGIQVGDYDVSLVRRSACEDPPLLYTLDRLSGPYLHPACLGEPRQGHHELVGSALGYPHPLRGHHRGHRGKQGRRTSRRGPGVEGVYGDDLLEPLRKPGEAVQVALGCEPGKARHTP